jgi:hypothetical protein
MNRRLSIVIAVVAAGSLGLSLTSCNAPGCGPGTVQQQQKDGTLKCVQADQPEPLTQCDVDAGNVVIVGGKCVSAIQCDPATTTNENGVCVGHGGTAGCRAPASGKACVAGTIYDFKTNAKNTVAPLHVELFDALQLLQGGAPIVSTDLATDGGSYVFQDFTPPNFGIIVVMTGRTNATMTAAGTGAQNVSAGNQYVVDLYAIKKADSDAWGGGFNVATGGAYIAKFYSNMKPDPKILLATQDTTPVAGVTLTKDSAPAAGAQYFNDTLSAIDTNLMATGASGVAIVASPIPMGGSFPNFSGTGPTAMPITWETLPGGSAPGVVIITRFHPNM